MINFEITEKKGSCEKAMREIVNKFPKMFISKKWDKYRGNQHYLAKKDVDAFITNRRIILNAEDES